MLSRIGLALFGILLCFRGLAAAAEPDTLKNGWVLASYELNNHAVVSIEEADAHRIIIFDELKNRSFNYSETLRSDGSIAGIDEKSKGVRFKVKIPTDSKKTCVIVLTDESWTLYSTEKFRAERNIYGDNYQRLKTELMKSAVKLSKGTIK